MKKLFELIIPLSMLLTALPVNSEKKKAQMAILIRRRFMRDLGLGQAQIIRHTQSKKGLRLFLSFKIESYLSRQNH